MDIIRDKLDPWVGRWWVGLRGWVGIGVKRRVVCPLSLLLLLLLRGLTWSAGCQKGKR